MDAVHPRHNPIAGYGWIKRGDEYEIPTNTGRDRLNINGAVNIDSLEVEVRYDDRINGQSTINLLKRIESKNKQASKIYIICDNAKYYHSTVVNEYLKFSKVELVFLPPYAPNLNLIERYWKLFKKTILYGKYYETLAELKTACDDFFRKSGLSMPAMRTLLREKFEIIYA